MEEIWKDIKNYENYYQVSNLGRVRSLDRTIKDIRSERLYKGKILKQSLCNWGYLTVSLKKSSKSKKFLVHRLVAEAFLPNPDMLEVVNHKDENKLNNCVSNLEWSTLKDNMLYSKRSNKRSILQYDKTGKFIKIWNSITEAAEHFKVDISLLSQCLSGKNASAANYVWRYYSDNFPSQIDTSDLNFSKKPVYQYSLSGTFIKEWESCSNAEDTLHIASGNISSACSGKLKTAGGFQWRYKSGTDGIHDITKYQSKIRKVSQYTLDGVLVKVWDNARKAAISLGLRDGNQILLCCKGFGKTCKGYIWKYAE